MKFIFSVFLILFFGNNFLLAIELNLINSRQFNYTNLIDSVLQKNKLYDCNRLWPKLELLLPISLNRAKNDPRYWEYETLFLRSFLLVWPLKLVSNTTLSIIYDFELRNSAALKEMKSTFLSMKHLIFGGLNFHPIQPSTYYRNGGDRQQLVMFWADNFTTSEYIGFVDTDTVFLTYIDREDLFENNKPVINGRSMSFDEDGWNLMPSGTYKTLNILEPMRCMSYFPVIIKRIHIIEIREYIMKLHNKSFNDYFYQNLTGTAYSQFNIFCTYLFKYHLNEYQFYIHSVNKTWNGIDPSPYAGQDSNISQFTQDMYRPKPRIALHARYRASINTPKVQ